MSVSKFVYYSKSSDKPPGYGAGESLANHSDYFVCLSKIKDWRKVLSNFFLTEIEYDQLHFASAEHAWHYAKYKSIGQLTVAQRFSLESKDPIANLPPDKVKVLAGKNKRISLYVMNLSEIVIWERIRDKCVYDILYNKFSKSIFLADMLCHTRDAELWHFMGRTKGSERNFILEQIRSDLGTY